MVAAIAEVVVLLLELLRLLGLRILLLGLRCSCSGCSCGTLYTPGVQVGDIPYLSVTFPAVTPYIEIHFQHLSFLVLVYHAATLVNQLERSVIGKHHTGRAFICQLQYEFSF